MSEQDKDKHPFKANAHLLKLLGDQLIGDDRLAIFELVKNAYDADADSVDVTVDLEADVPSIIVWDHKGDGMSLSTVKDKWLEIGTSSKRGKNRTRTKKQRLPLGEKGVGRLAVHKLGSQLVINTKAKNSKEVKIEIDWPQLLSDATYIHQATVKAIELSTPEIFTNDNTGTRIQITDLHNISWERKHVRKLARLVNTLQSPFKSPDTFEVNLDIKGREEELKDILEVEDVLTRAIWTFDFTLSEDGEFSYTYTFNPPETLIGLKTTTKNMDDKLELVPLNKEQRLLRKKADRDKFLVTPSDLEGIGPISGKFYVYTGNRKVLNAQGSYQELRNYLDEQSGIRIYRDGIRVFNYGEPSDDWLELNVKRLNNPGTHISTNNIIAAIDLELEASSGLEEKTNREGFDENKNYQMFHHVIKSIYEQLRLIHLQDRTALEEATKSPKDPVGNFEDNIADIKEVIKENGLEKDLKGKIEQIETEFKDLRNVTVTAGIAGMNLSVIFHEVEKGVDQLNSDIQRNADYEQLKLRADQLAKIVEGFTPLLRRNEHSKFKISDIVNDAFNDLEFRLEDHGIVSSWPILTDESPDFAVKAPYGLVRGALSNVMENAIHWLKLEHEKRGDKYKPALKVLSMLDAFEEGPALVVLDNGPGFSLPADLAVQAFKTNRSGGAGLGLFYVDQLMTSLRGRVVITTAEELELDEVHDGAAVVLVFNRKALG
ncbi:ATP-binding protein [Vibrio splendidus]|uniref:ATP-binding protein n=1 Tax=Vibrio splendidus TaxID=29497 RepID=UPI0024697DA6|nr:ATP-binding protein [Vibrio splendidus]MDH5902846.1 ATP-binding protein [Vibrio splendidus]